MIATNRTPPAPERRWKRAQLKDLVLEAGVTILLEEGLDNGAGQLTFKRVFDRVEADTGVRVTNGSVIGRIWEDTADFQSEVLAQIVSDENQDEIDEALEAAAAVLDDAELTTEAGIRATLGELCRVGGGAHFRALTASRTWQLFVGIWGTTTSARLGPEPSRIEAAAAETYAKVTARFEDVMRGFAEVLHLRLRDGFEMRQFVVALMSLSEGCALRDRLDAANTRDVRRRSGPNGEVQEWTLFSVGFEALVWQFFEIAL